MSVFGFFSHSRADQYAIAKNLARGYEEYLEENGYPLETALAWALEAQSIIDGEAIQAIIKRISNKINNKPK